MISCSLPDLRLKERQMLHCRIADPFYVSLRMFHPCAEREEAGGPSFLRRFLFLYMKLTISCYLPASSYWHILSH